MASSTPQRAGRAKGDLSITAGQPYVPKRGRAPPRPTDQARQWGSIASWEPSISWSVSLFFSFFPSLNKMAPFKWAVPRSPVQQSVVQAASQRSGCTATMPTSNLQTCAPSRQAPPTPTADFVPSPGRRSSSSIRYAPATAVCAAPAVASGLRQWGHGAPR